MFQLVTDRLFSGDSAMVQRAHWGVAARDVVTVEDVISIADAQREADNDRRDYRGVRCARVRGARDVQCAAASGV